MSEIFLQNYTKFGIGHDSQIILFWFVIYM